MEQRASGRAGESLEDHQTADVRQGGVRFIASAGVAGCLKNHNGISISQDKTYRLSSKVRESLAKSFIRIVIFTCKAIAKSAANSGMVNPILRLANCADTKPTVKGNAELPRLPLANSQLDLRVACPPRTCEKMAIVVGKIEESPSPAS